MIKSEQLEALRRLRKFMQSQVADVAIASPKFAGKYQQDADALAAAIATIEGLPVTKDGTRIVPGTLVVPPCGHSPQPAVIGKPIRCYEGTCKGEPFYGENDYYEPGDPSEYTVEQCITALAAKGGGDA